MYIFKYCLTIKVHKYKSKIVEYGVLQCNNYHIDVLAADVDYSIWTMLKLL